MTKDEWLSIINKVDEKYISELSDHHLKNYLSKKEPSKEDITVKPQYIKMEETSRFPFKKAAIAVAAVVCVAAAGIFMRVNNKPQTSSPNDSVTISDSGTTQPVGDVSGTGNYAAEFNYTIPQDLSTRVPKIRLKSRKLDEELVKNALLRGKTISKETEEPRAAFYYTSDDCRLTVFRDGSITFFDDKVFGRSCDYGSVVPLFNDITYTNDEELKAFSRKDAVERVNKILDEIGIENYGEPHITAVTPEMGNAKLSEGVSLNFGSDYTPWTDNDGVYILRYPIKINGVNVSADPVKAAGTGATIDGTEIRAYVAKDGVFYLETGTIYDIVSGNEETIDFKFDAEYASNDLKNYYSKLMLEYPTFFTECKLEYIPTEITSDGEYIFAPAWCFSGYRLKGPDLDVVKHFAEYYYVDTGIRYGGY